MLYNYSISVDTLYIHTKYLIFTEMIFFTDAMGFSVAMLALLRFCTWLLYSARTYGVHTHHIRIKTNISAFLIETKHYFKTYFLKKSISINIHVYYLCYYPLFQLFDSHILINSHWKRIKSSSMLDTLISRSTPKTWYICYKQISWATS